MESSQAPGLGALYSGEDYRDSYALIGAAALAMSGGNSGLPDSLHHNTGGVMNQNKTPSCVAHSLVKLHKIYWFQQTGKWINFSPRFLDTLMKRTDGQNREFGGAFPRVGLKLLATVGCATELTVPNNTSLPTLSYRADSILTPAAMAEAGNYKLPGFVNVPRDLQSTREAIDMFGAVSTLYQVGEELWTPSWKDKDIDPLRIPKAIVSGHQMTQVGYPSLSSGFNIVENQWSADWANKGSVMVNYSQWLPFMLEQWAPAIIPADTKLFLSHLPSPRDFHFTWNVPMAQGDQNEQVKYLQIALMILGYLEPVEPDSLGLYGPRTTIALTKYLSANGVHADGKNAGPITMKLLNTRFAL